MGDGLQTSKRSLVLTVWRVDAKPITSHSTMKPFVSSAEAFLCLLNSSFTYWSPRARRCKGRNRCRTRILLYRKRTLETWAGDAISRTEESPNEPTVLGGNSCGPSWRQTLKVFKSSRLVSAGCLSPSTSPEAADWSVTWWPGVAAESISLLNHWVSEKLLEMKRLFTWCQVSISLSIIIVIIVIIITTNNCQIIKYN